MWRILFFIVITLPYLFYSKKSIHCKKMQTIKKKQHFDIDQQNIFLKLNYKSKLNSVIFFWKWSCVMNSSHILDASLGKINQKNISNDYASDLVPPRRSQAVRGGFAPAMLQGWQRIERKELRGVMLLEQTPFLWQTVCGWVAGKCVSPGCSCGGEVKKSINDYLNTKCM